MMILSRGLFSFLFFLSCFSVFPVLSADTSKKTLKVAVVDMERVSSEYSFINQAMEDIELKEIALKKLLYVANQELDKLTAQLNPKDKSSLEFDKKKKEIQASIDKAYLDLDGKKKEYSLTIEARINTTLDKFAKSEKYDLILNKAYTLQDGVDITDSFLKQLEALQ